MNWLYLAVTLFAPGEQPSSNTINRKTHSTIHGRTSLGDIMFFIKLIVSP
jgi:hypothetical protein